MGDNIIVINGRVPMGLSSKMVPSPTLDSQGEKDKGLGSGVGGF